MIQSLIIKSKTLEDVIKTEKKEEDVHNEGIVDDKDLSVEKMKEQRKHHQEQMIQEEIEKADLSKRDVIEFKKIKEEKERKIRPILATSKAIRIFEIIVIVLHIAFSQLYVINVGDLSLQQLWLFNQQVTKSFNEINDCEKNFKDITNADQVNTWMRECLITT